MFKVIKKNRINVYKSSIFNESKISAFFTTRIGSNTPAPLNSFSLGTAGKNEFVSHVQENRKKLCKTFNLNYDNLVIPDQRHTDNINIISGSKDNVNFCDALITDVPNLALMLLFADCVPLIFYAEDKNVIAVVHAGWRGTEKQIALKTALKIENEFRADLSKLNVAIGPAIGQCCYPVSADVAAKLEKTVNISNNKLFRKSGDLINVDLKNINVMQLKELGVKNIDILDDCTSCNNSVFYSYRKEKGNTGRHAAVGSIK